MPDNGSIASDLNNTNYKNSGVEQLGSSSGS